MSAAKRRRRQMSRGYTHLARLCGKHIKGGRPIYRRRSTGTVAEAIARERAAAVAEQRRRKAKK